MAKFEQELPTDILKDFDFLQNNAINIFGKMTRAGAEVAKDKLLITLNEHLIARRRQS